LNATKIEWVKNPDGSQGYTWNPITGCNNQIDGICQGGHFPCYAYRLANGRLRSRYLANKNTASSNYDEDSYPFYPRFWPERMDELAKRNTLINYKRGYSVKPIGIFPCDMSDLFGIGIPEEWTYDILELIRENDYDRFYLLTKQPQNLLRWSPFPPNCWVGVTVTSPFMFYKACEFLAKIDATKTFLSLEPFLQEIKIPEAAVFNDYGISWLIIGAQTKPYKLPKIEWVEEIVRAADKAGVAVFLKDNLKPILPVADPYFLPFEKLGMPELRQEMPKEGGC
jgi:protein gp37